MVPGPSLSNTARCATGSLILPILVNAEPNHIAKRRKMTPVLVRTVEEGRVTRNPGSHVLVPRSWSEEIVSNG
jgi:hypothetical protein